MNWNEIFEYRDGKLYWNKKTNRNIVIGSLAGSLRSGGYLRVGAKGSYHYVHRIVWEMHNGDIPEGMEIDHINGSRSDNRVENLRIVSHSENQKKHENE
ncbi:HNH homing endonuclease [Shigella phage Sf12]|uniref:HNH homing endonuclease n=1 Tax=Shigella phage Sf12 TaxID=2024315 RepID=A0A291AXM2_9CAUD|nr:HNH endonuclease [Shigella phage Sf12]ATE85769.1 HNH homing endonuclease [Shigella phage Sf12]